MFVAQKNIIIISDYGAGDPAFLEVILRIKTLIPNSYIYPQSVPAFSTICTGFWIKQISIAPNLKNTYIFSNTAPRKHEKKEQKNNHGEHLMYAKLKNGLEIIAVNSGFTFSFIKDQIKSFHQVKVKNEGSQFRSRDFYPQAVALMAKGKKNFMGKKDDINSIPDYPTNRVASIDGYGNIKTTLRLSQVKLEPGQSVVIEINSQKHLATYTDGVFNIKDGELAFAPGSSGDGDRFMEFFVRGGNAYKLFEGPLVETEFTIKKA